MSRYSASSKFEHGQRERTAVLLVQLGTPDKPETGAVRKYLREFLSDTRVVEFPRAVWLPILNGAILPTRPAKSARKYAKIWHKDGSPLLVNTQAQAKMLRGYTGNRGLDIEVAFAMRYGNPSVASTLRELREKNVTRLLVLPLYPQYAGATTATAFDAVTRELSTWLNLPELRFVRSFHNLPSYIDALVARIRGAWGNDGPPDKLVMSFHGVPRASLLAGDPYHCECQVTARLLAERLGLSNSQWTLSFQSRFGRAEWLKPYTDKVLSELGKQKTGRVDLVCPGFVSDCLETLEEIAIEGRQTFENAGGGDFRYIPCVNDANEFVIALADLVALHSGGWPAQRKPEGAGPAAEDPTTIALKARKERAVALGAAV